MKYILRLIDKLILAIITDMAFNSVSPLRRLIWRIENKFNK